MRESHASQNTSHRYDVAALGELLIDFTPCGTSNKGNNIFEANPGGAPCNVLAMVSKLGGRTAFIGKVGNDRFGNFLYQSVARSGVDISNLLRDSRYQTTLAFVHLDEQGNRSFSFYRDYTADLMLEPSDIDRELIQDSAVFHFGTLSMVAEPARAATKAAVEIAKSSGCTISFDPNIRLGLWSDRAALREVIDYALDICDILKLSEEELRFIAGAGELAAAMKFVVHAHQGIKLLIVTLGQNGCAYLLDGEVGSCAAYEVNAIDTTGAGDAFIGYCLYHFSRQPLETLDVQTLLPILRGANAAAALVTTRLGALAAMPDRIEIDRMLQ